MIMIPIIDKVSAGEQLKIPHIGWGTLVPAEGSPDWSGTLLANTRSDEYFYFVHSQKKIHLLDSHAVLS